MMLVAVTCEEKENGWLCHVSVTEEDSTKHEVTVTKEDYEKLTQGKIRVEDLVRKSFDFLLKREHKEAILPAFDIMEIAHYFPEFEKQIK